MKTNLHITYTDLYEISGRYEIHTDRVRKYVDSVNDVLTELHENHVFSNAYYNATIEKAYNQKGYDLEEVDEYLTELYNNNQHKLYYSEQDRIDAEVYTDENLYQAIDNPHLYFTDIEVKWNDFLTYNVEQASNYFDYFGIDDVADCVFAELAKRNCFKWVSNDIYWNNEDLFTSKTPIVEVILTLADKVERGDI